MNAREAKNTCAGTAQEGPHAERRRLNLIWWPPLGQRKFARLLVGGGQCGRPPIGPSGIVARGV